MMSFFLCFPSSSGFGSKCITNVRSTNSDSSDLHYVTTDIITIHSSAPSDGHLKTTQQVFVQSIRIIIYWSLRILQILCQIFTQQTWSGLSPTTVPDCWQIINIVGPKFLRTFTYNSPYSSPSALFSWA